MDGWMDGWESRVKDCLQQSKIATKVSNEKKLLPTFKKGVLKFAISSFNMLPFPRDGS